MAILAPWLVSCRSHSEEKPSEQLTGKDTWFLIGIGKTTLQLQVVITPEERALGLMHRKSLAEKHGMLFLSEKPERQSFWMKNTWLPLDIGFFAPDGELLEVQKLHPHLERSVKSRSENAMFAIELNRNAYRDANIGIGEKLNLTEVRVALETRGVDPSKYGL